MKKILLIYLLLCFQSIFSQKTGAKESFTVYDSINISTKDNKMLTLSVILNNSNKKPESTILINTIYSDIKNTSNAKYFAGKGYACVVLNTRGKYLSTNAIEPFEHEAEDINEAIDWIINQPWSNGKVGMIGGSYLGFSQWAATKKLHPALKTIVPMASVGVGTMDFPMRNNVFMAYTIRWLSQVMNNKMTDYADFNDEKKWNAIFEAWYKSGKSFRKLDSISGKPNAIFQRWLDHPGYDEYWQKMIPYNKQFSAINIPVLTTTGYYDWNQRGALYYFKEHYKYNKHANHYLIIGPYDHSGAQGNIGNSFRGYTIDPVAKIDLYKIWMEWLDYILKDKQKPPFLKDKINYQVMESNQWKSVNSIHVFDKKKLTFYLENKNNTLFLSSLKNNGKRFSILKIDLKDRSDAYELLNLKYNISDHFIYTKNNLLFTSEVLKESIELSGNFSGKLKFEVNKKDVDIYINLYELMPDGKYFLLSTSLSRASYAKDNENRKLLTPNTKESISIYNSEFVSKKIEKGSRLAAIIGIAKSPFWQLNYGSGKDVSDETIADAIEPLEIRLYNNSYIEIPVMQE